MTEPVVIKKDLTEEGLVKVQTLMTNLVNQTVPNTSTKVDDQPIPTRQSDAAEEQMKYKICVIENGQIKIPGENNESVVIDPTKHEALNNPQLEALNAAILKNGIQLPASNAMKLTPNNEMPQQLSNEDLQQQINSALHQQIINQMKQQRSNNSCNVPTNSGEQSQFGNSSENVPNAQSRSENQENTSESNNNNGLNPNKVEQLDSEVMNRLLDYYRKFNERQLGITVNPEAPGYTKSEETPISVVCDNDIIKEAVLRVGQKQAAGEIIREPTIIEVDSEEECEHDVGWRAVELERERQAHIQILVDEGDDLENDEVWRRYKEHLQCIDKKNYQDEWIFGANFIEKHLQKRIDYDKKDKTCLKKWDRKDIVRLVEMLSERRDKDKIRDGRTNSFANDDLMSKLEGWENTNDAFQGDTLFELLKRGEYGNDDASELKQMVAENCYKFKTEKVVTKHKKVYYGGEELVVVFDYIKYIFNLGWIWAIYEKIFGRFLYGISYENMSHNRQDTGWLKWMGKNWFSQWLPHSWRVTGKPIYKQVGYRDTEYSSAHQRDIGSDTRNRSVLTNRRGRSAGTSSGFMGHEYTWLDKQNEDRDNQGLLKNDDKSVVIHVEEESAAGSKSEIEGSAELQEMQDESDLDGEMSGTNDVAEEEEEESSDEDVIANFRKLPCEVPRFRRWRSEPPYLEKYRTGSPVPGQLYIDQPDGKIILNFK